MELVAVAFKCNFNKKNLSLFILKINKKIQFSREIMLNFIKTFSRSNLRHEKRMKLEIKHK